MKLLFVIIISLFAKLSEVLKKNFILLFFFVFLLIFIYIRDSNIQENLKQTIEPPLFIKLLKQNLATICNDLKNREFILALATGERNFSHEFRNNLINTGTMHIVAISAFHAGIMIFLFNIIFKTLFFFFPLRHQKKQVFIFCLKILGAVFYFFITGASIPTLRAISFILFLDLFIIFGTYPHSLQLFFISLFAVTLLIPGSIVSLSFIMSSICVATLLQIYKTLPKSITLKLISISIVINYSLIPVYSTISGTFPMSAPVTNLFVIPIVSISVPFITAAQFSIIFSNSLCKFFLNIADKIIEPANFLISFSGESAHKFLIPLIEPSFYIKTLFVLTFFIAIYFHKKIKIFAIIANFVFLSFFAFNFQTTSFSLTRSEFLFNRCYCITYPDGSGRLFFDRYKFNPVFNYFILNRMEKTASFCGINNIISVHTPRKIKPEIEKKIKERIRFKNVHLYEINKHLLYNEDQHFSPFFLFYDPSL